MGHNQAARRSDRYPPCTCPGFHGHLDAPQSLEEMLPVQALLLTVDSAPAERDLHRFKVGVAGFVGTALGDLEPQA